MQHHAVAVPKIALMPREIREAVNTTDESFGKIINKQPKKVKSRSPIREEQQTPPRKISPKNQNTTFGKKKDSSTVPYPMRSKTIGETLQETGFNRSNRFNSSNHNQEANDTVGIASKG